MFCKEHNSPYSELFENAGWLAKLCYLAEIFDKLNELNVGLQGKGANILTLHDKISGFVKKIDLWKKTCQKADYMLSPIAEVHFHGKSRNKTDKGNDR